MSDLLHFAGNRLTKLRKSPASTSDDYTFYSYDHRNRLVAVTFREGDDPSDDQLSKVEYGYDVFDRRIYITNRDAADAIYQQARFIYDGWDVVVESYAYGSRCKILVTKGGQRNVDRSVVPIRELSSMAREPIAVQLTPTERSLLLRYGYPFAQIEQALQAVSASKAIEIVPLDGFELERLIGDLGHTIKNMDGGRIQD